MQLSCRMNVIARYKDVKSGSSKFIHILHTTQLDTMGSYSCLECNRPVIPVRGTLVAWHFRHVAADGDCSNNLSSFRLSMGGESKWHVFAKEYISQTLSEWTFTCMRCDKDCHYQSHIAKTEYRIQEYVLDIGVLTHDNPNA